MKKTYQFVLRFFSALIIFGMLFVHSGNEKSAVAGTENILAARMGESIAGSSQVEFAPKFLLNLPINLQVKAPAQSYPSQPAKTQISTGQPASAAAPDTTSVFLDFRRQVSNGQAGIIRGVFVEGVLSLRVLQQPAGDWSFVSGEDGTATQFQSAAQNGVTGLLAHNFLSGKLYFNLKLGQKVFIVFGDGKFLRYQIKDIQRYQKVDSNSLTSDLIDLRDGKRMSVGEVFNRVYTGRGQVTFQTCIEKDGNWTWGLIFIIAAPM